MMILYNLFQALLLRAVDTASVRFAARLLGLGLLACVLCGALARGDDVAPAAGSPGEHGHAAPGEETPEAPAATTTAKPLSPIAAFDYPEDIPAAVREPAVEPRFLSEKPPADPAARVQYYEEIARFHWRTGDRVAAERAFAQVLHVNIAVEAKRPAMLALAEFYEQGHEASKAIAVLEKLLAVFPGGTDRAELLLRVGMLYRTMGATEAATSRFFQVLNSTLRVAPAEFEAYRALARKAQLEIADTHAAQGNVEEARKWFARLQVLDLEPADRQRVMFRTAQLRHALKQWAPAELELRTFLQAYPGSVYMPEARYLRAKTLDQLGRKDDAVQEVVELLRSPVSDEPEQARQAALWKRRTGNELANQFYEQGDFHGALAIYQALARAGSDPAWTWPAIYQVGLCFERLHLPKRAAEAYQVILAPDGAARIDAGLPQSLASLQEMARWRMQHLDWVEDFGQRLQVLTADMSAGP